MDSIRLLAWRRNWGSEPSLALSRMKSRSWGLESSGKKSRMSESSYMPSMRRSSKDGSSIVNRWRKKSSECCNTRLRRFGSSILHWGLGHNRFEKLVSISSIFWPSFWRSRRSKSDQLMVTRLTANASPEISRLCEYMFSNPNVDSQGSVDKSTSTQPKSQWESS